MKAATKPRRHVKNGYKPKTENGRPPYVPKPEEIAQVQALAGFGLAEREIADFLKISRETYRKAFSEDARRARPKLMAMAAGGLFAALQKKESWAIKYVHNNLGKKFGWGQAPEQIGINPMDLLAKADPSKLSDEKLTLLIDLLAAIGVDVGGKPTPLLIGEGQGR